MLAPTHIAFASVVVLGAHMLLNRPCSLLGLGYVRDTCKNRSQ